MEHNSKKLFFSLLDELSQADRSAVLRSDNQLVALLRHRFVSDDVFRQLVTEQFIARSYLDDLDILGMSQRVSQLREIRVRVPIFEEQRGPSVPLTDLALSSLALWEIAVRVKTVLRQLQAGNGHVDYGLDFEPPRVVVTSGSINFSITGSSLVVGGIGLVIAAYEGLLPGSTQSLIAFYGGSFVTALGLPVILAETYKIAGEGKKAHAETEKLRAETEKLTREAAKLGAEEQKLLAEKDKLVAEASKLGGEKKDSDLLAVQCSSAASEASARARSAEFAQKEAEFALSNSEERLRQIELDDKRLQDLRLAIPSRIEAVSKLSSPMSVASAGLVPERMIYRLAKEYGFSEELASHLVNHAMPLVAQLSSHFPGTFEAVRNPSDSD